MGVKDTVNNLVSKDVLLKGFQQRGISVYQVNLLSFSYSPGQGQAQSAQPPAIVITTRESSSASPRCSHTTAWNQC